MNKIDLSIGSKVFYNDVEHIILKAVNFHTLSMAPVNNQKEIINVKIQDLSSMKQEKSNH